MERRESHYEKADLSRRIEVCGPRPFEIAGVPYAHSSTTTLTAGKGANVDLGRQVDYAITEAPGFFDFETVAACFAFLEE